MDFIKKLKDVGTFIKYDGKKSPTQLKEIEEEKERVKQAQIERKNDQAQSDWLKEERRQANIKYQKQLVKRREKLLARQSLDDQERELDGELDYYDKLNIPCNTCGKDIMDINSMCSADACGAYSNRSPPCSWAGGNYSYRVFSNGGGGAPASACTVSGTRISGSE